MAPVPASPSLTTILQKHRHQPLAFTITHSLFLDDRRTIHCSTVNNRHRFRYCQRSQNHVEDASGGDAYNAPTRINRLRTHKLVSQGRGNRRQSCSYQAQRKEKTRTRWFGRFLCYVLAAARLRSWMIYADTAGSLQDLRAAWAMLPGLPVVAPKLADRG